MNDQTLLKFNQHLSLEESTLLDSLDAPVKIQAFLDKTLYSAENANRSPLRVLRERSAHCLDGAIFAAAVMRRNGETPLILDLLPAAGLDDDHVLTIFKRNDRFGAVAKSNFTGLRMREPVFLTIRELVMSYFEDFFNVDGLKTMRGYTRCIDLRHYDHTEWMWSDAGVDKIEKRLYKLKQKPLLDLRMISSLSPVDSISYQAGMMIVNPAGLYQPKRDQPK